MYTLLFKGRLSVGRTLGTSETTNLFPSAKLFPWFVSDVTPADFEGTITSLLSTTFFPGPPFPDIKSRDHLGQMVARWRSYLEQGIFTLCTDLAAVDDQKVDAQALTKFWTEPYPYWDMKQRAGQLWEWLHTSDLVIFKVRTSPVGSVQPF